MKRSLLPGIIENHVICAKRDDSFGVAAPPGLCHLIQEVVDELYVEALRLFCHCTSLRLGSNLVATA